MFAFLIVCVLIVSVAHAQQSLVSNPLIAYKNTNAVVDLRLSKCAYIKQQMRKLIGIPACPDPKKYCTDEKCHNYLYTALAIPSNGLSFCYFGILVENGVIVTKSDILKKQDAAKAIFRSCNINIPAPATFPPKGSPAPATTAPASTAPLTTAPATNAPLTNPPLTLAPRTTANTSTPVIFPNSNSNRVEAVALISMICAFAVTLI